MPKPPIKPKLIFRQVWRHKIIIALLLIPILLTGCGKRPSEVDLPEGVPEDGFPKVYPNPATDPKT